MTNVAITYNLNNKDTTINFDITQKASAFKNKICTNEKIKSESFEFYYKDLPLPEKPLKEIFGTDAKPKIKVLAIGISNY